MEWRRRQRAFAWHAAYHRSNKIIKILFICFFQLENSPGATHTTVCRAKKKIAPKTEKFGSVANFPFAHTDQHSAMVIVCGDSTTFYELFAVCRFFFNSRVFFFFVLCVEIVNRPDFYGVHARMTRATLTGCIVLRMSAHVRSPT